MELTNVQWAKVAGTLALITDQGGVIVEEDLREAIHSVVDPDIFITADDLAGVRELLKKDRPDLAGALRGRVLLFGSVQDTIPVLEVLEGGKDKTDDPSTTEKLLAQLHFHFGDDIFADPLFENLHFAESVYDDLLTLLVEAVSLKTGITQRALRGLSIDYEARILGKRGPSFQADCYAGLFSAHDGHQPYNARALVGAIHTFIPSYASVNRLDRFAIGGWTALLFSNPREVFPYLSAAIRERREVRRDIRLLATLANTMSRNLDKPPPPEKKAPDPFAGGLISAVDLPVVTLDETDDVGNSPEHDSKEEIPDFFHRYRPPVSPADRPVRPMGKVLRFIRK